MRYLLSFLILFTSTWLLAQIVVHFDRPFHVSGEVIHYSAKFPSPAPSKVRVTIYAPDGRPLDYYFLQGQQEGIVEGYYRLPYDIESGYYRIQFSALNIQQQVVDLGVVQHPVYDIDVKPVNPPTANLEGVKTQNLSAGDLKVDIQGNDIRITGLEGSPYSLSVYNETLFPSSNPTATIDITTRRLGGPWIDTLFYAGSVIDETEQPVQTNLLPIFDPSTYQFYFSKSNQEGQFIAEIGAFEGEKVLQVQHLSGANITPQLQMEKMSEFLEVPPLTEEVYTYADLARRRRKIYQIYATVETQLNVTPEVQHIREIKSNKSFAVQNYKAFPDMFTFFKEVGGELRIRKRRDGYEARLYNAPNQKFFKDTPLFIVDGKLTHDVELVGKMKPSDIESLDYYYVGKELRKEFPALGNNGVVRLETIRPLMEFPRANQFISIKGLQPTTDYIVRTSEGSIPAISPLLLWQTGKAGEASLSVPLPKMDDFGSYRIVLVSYKSDGSINYATTQYNVTLN